MVHGGSWHEKGLSTEQGGRGCSAEAARSWLSGRLYDKRWPRLRVQDTQDDSSEEAGHLSLMK